METVEDDGRVQTNGKKPVRVLKEDLKILRDFRLFLTATGIWMERDGPWTIYTALIVLYFMFAIVVCMNSLLHYTDHMENCAVIIHHSMLALDVIVSTCLFFWKRATIRRLVSGMCLSYNYHSFMVSEFLRGLEEKRIKDLKFGFKCFVFICGYNPINLMIFGAFEKYTRDDIPFMLLFPCWFPFDLSYLPFHIAAYCWEASFVVIICLTIGGVLGVIFLVYSHLTTQLALLCFALDKTKERGLELIRRNEVVGSSTLVKRMSVVDNDAERNVRDSCILGSKMCAEHHIQIIEYYNDAQDVFRIVYLFVFVTGLVLLTFTGFALISDNTSLKIKFILITLVQLIYLYAVCWFGEKIGDSSEEVRLSIYGIDWSAMPKECRSTFRLMTERTMKPLGFRTSTGQKVDLQNYMSMIKASYSYFNMMMASQEKK